MDESHGGEHGVRPDAGTRVLGQLLAAQNVLPALPTAQRVAEFYAVALASVPGVSEARVCLPGARSEAGTALPETCGTCAYGPSERGREQAEPADLDCALSGLPGLDILALDTQASRYGFFVLKVDDAAAYRRYAPFVANLASFMALWLENRAQQDHLRQAHDALERRVAERTAQLRSANAKLHGEVQERRRAELMIRQLNEELEQRVRDRTRELEAANEELEAFAYSVSHDLRAPLRHLLGFADLLHGQGSQQLDDDQQHYLEAILVSARRMGQLVDDLLAFSRMNRTALFSTDVDLEGLAKDVIRDFEPDIAGRRVRRAIERLPRVTGDPAMLRVVLENLVGNALKFTRSRPTAEITIGSLRCDGPQVVLYVRDNGVGFDMAQADRLFGVFERLHPTTDSFEGNGIGLASVRRIVQRHGGTVWARAGVDQGATFYFSLPAEPPLPGSVARRSA